MNRLEELYEECGVYIDPHSTSATRKEIEFYAEQIVKECVKICDQLSWKYHKEGINDIGAWRAEVAASTCAAAILEHFGANNE